MSLHLGISSAASATEETRPPRGRVFANALVTLPFVLLFLIQLAHHQMWRDELHVFGEVSASPSLKTLYHYIHYDGHPSLYYLVIWIGTKWIATPAVLKIAQAVIGILIYWMIGVVSPFSGTEKILLFLSYFVSFEYTVMSRTYGLCFLLVLIYVDCRLKHPKNLMLNALLLGLIANTDIVGFIISAALAAEYGFNQVRTEPRSNYFNRTHTGAALLYLALLAFSFWTVKPPPDISWRTTGRILQNFSPVHFGSVATNYMVIPWLPVKLSKYPAHFWDPVAAEHPVFFFLMLPLIVVAYYLLFRKDRDLLCMLAFTALAAIAFGALIYTGNVRNFGITFMAFLAALWMQRYRRPPVMPTLVSVLLSLSAAMGIAAAYAQWTHPFSNVGAAAGWLRAHQLERVQIMGSPDSSLAGLSQELGRPVYFLDCRCSDTFLLFSNRRDDFDESRIPERVVEAARRFAKPESVLVLVRRMTSRESEEIQRGSLQITPLAQFSGAEAFQEDYFFYMIQRKEEQL